MNNNANSILNLLSKEYNWIDKTTYTKFNNQSNFSSPLQLIKFLLNILSVSDKENLSIVLPSKKNLCYILTIYLALEKVRKNYSEFLSDFEKFLVPGQNIRYCLDNEQKGKIFKYIGKKKGSDDITIIETFPYGNTAGCRIEKKIANLLQFYPTNKTKPIGKTPPRDYFPPSSNIDNILDIQSFNNPMILRNFIILLTVQKNFMNFLETQKINDIKLKDFITVGQINDSGDLEDFENLKITDPKDNSEVFKIEPLIIYCHSIHSLYEFFKKNKNEKIVITDEISKINNITLIRQIKEINKNIKFYNFSSYSDFEYLNEYQEKIDDTGQNLVWKFEKSEIKDWLEIDAHSFKNLNDLNSLDSNSKIKKYFSNYIKKEVKFFDFPENIFDKINRKLEELKKIIKMSQNQEDLKQVAIRQIYLKMRMQDYIFGFDNEIKARFISDLKSLVDYRSDRKNLLTNQEYDALVKIEELFKQIDLNNDSFFQDRIKLLKDFIESSKDIYNKSSTTFIVDNPKIANYYKTNILKKFGLEFDINSTFRPKRNYEFAIILSELSEKKISTILNENHYKSIIFFSGPTFKQTINNLQSIDFTKWKKFLLNKDLKAELTKIKNINPNYFNYNEHQRYSDLVNNNINQIFIEKNFDISKILDDQDSNDEKIDANFVEFYGDCYCFFSKNSKIKVLNNIFFHSGKGNQSIIEKDIKNLLVDDYVLIRDSADRDVIESEARLISRDAYDAISKTSVLWLDLIWKHLELSGPNAKKKKLEYTKILRKNKYNKSDGTIRNLLGNTIICPDEIEDLKILMNSLNEYVGNIIIEKKEIDKIYQAASNIKSLHRKSGRNISRKISSSLITQEINIDREPMRVDYNIDGTITLNSDKPDYPEAWIVQVKRIDLKDHKVSKINLNRLKWL